MKISNSKKQLAEIIHENGGWFDGAEFSAQDKDGEVFHYATKPSIDKGSEVWGHKGCIGYGEFPAKTLPNWHQTILSREEYFHLYPATDADGWIEWEGGECPVEGDAIIDIRFRDGHEERGVDADWDWEHSGGGDIIAYRPHKPEQAQPEFCKSVMRAIPEPTAKPTIEQLAADYRNAKDYADRKQQEADAAKADAEAKLAELVAAAKALGLVLSVADVESELVITDWRDLQERDVIWFCGDDEQGEGEYSVLEVEHRDYGGKRAVRIDTIGNDYWIDVSDGWKFIRRP